MPRSIGCPGAGSTAGRIDLGGDASRPGALAGIRQVGPAEGDRQPLPPGKPMSGSQTLAGKYPSLLADLRRHTRPIWR